MRSWLLTFILLLGFATPAAALTVNINTAVSAELELLPKIGKAKALAIIRYRQNHGPFRDIAEIKKVKGIGEKIFLLNRDKLTVSGPTILAPAEGRQPQPAKSRRRAGKIYPRPNASF